MAGAERVDCILGMDSTTALRGRAEALDEAAWTRLARPAGHVSPTGTTRARREDHKQRIDTERGYLVWDGTPDAHGTDVQGDHVHSSIRARFVAVEEGVKVESPQRSEENRP
jgi:hypothetical protein